MTYGILPNLGIPELIIILVICLVLFGPSKLPSLGKGVGQAIREFKNSMHQADENASTRSESDV